MKCNVRKSHENIALLRRAKLFVPQNILIKLYNALIMPHFTYCSTVWNDGCCSHINKLFKLQKRAARVITASTYEVRSTEIQENLDWITVEKNLKNRETIMSMPFKALTGKLPKYVVELFTKCENEN